MRCINKQFIEMLCNPFNKSLLLAESLNICFESESVFFSFLVTKYYLDAWHVSSSVFKFCKHSYAGYQIAGGLIIPLSSSLNSSQVWSTLWYQLHFGQDRWCQFDTTGNNIFMSLYLSTSIRFSNCFILRSVGVHVKFSSSDQKVNRTLTILPDRRRSAISWRVLRS